MDNNDLKDGLRPEIREKIIAVLSALFPGSKIYLFGSRATGTFQRTSDIDIAIDAGHKLPIEAINEANDVMKALSIVYKVDVLDLHNVASNIKDNILKNKVLWKS